MARATSSSSTVRWNNLALLTSVLACAGQAWAVPKGDSSGHVKAGESIQAALDNARPGDEIHVGPGTYAEQVTIDKDEITLIGHGAIIVPPTTFINNTCSGLSGNGTEAGICVTGSGISLDPYVFEHRKVSHVDCKVKGVVVTGFEVRGFTGQNIAVVGGYNTEIIKNTLINGDNYGFLTAGSLNTLARGNNITTDEIRFIGMCMDDEKDAEFIDNDVTGYYIGLCLQTNGGLLKKNRVKNTCVGTFVDPGVEGASVIENHVSAANPGCPSDGPRGGINLDGTKGVLVLGNLVEGQHNNGTSAGIVLVDDFDTPGQFVATDNVIKKNTLRDNDYGIFNNSTGSGNEVKHNKCTGVGCPTS